MVWPTLGSRTAKEQNRTEPTTCCDRQTLYCFVDFAPHTVQAVPVTDYIVV